MDAIQRVANFIIPRPFVNVGHVLRALTIMVVAFTKASRFYPTKVEDLIMQHWNSALTFPQASCQLDGKKLNMPLRAYASTYYVLYPSESARRNTIATEISSRAVDELRVGVSEAEHDHHQD